MTRAQKGVLILIVLASCGIGAYFARSYFRNSIAEAKRQTERTTLPVAKPYVPPTNKNTNANKNTNSNANSNGNKNTNKPVTPPAKTVPAEANLAVPFTSQAPFKVWDEIHEDACEEASMLMVNRYFSRKPIASPQDADDELRTLIKWEDEHFGHNHDITADEVATVLRERYGYAKVELLRNPTLAQIKASVAQGLPVIVPVAGKMLKNPNFKNGGPPYHMFVLKGYTSDGNFITNDPGTRLGADYLYPTARIMDAIHDWNDGDVMNGEKVVIIVHPK